MADRQRGARAPLAAVLLAATFALLFPATAQAGPMGHPLSPGPPVVRGWVARVTDPLQQAVVARTIPRARAMAAMCFQRALRTVPTLQGMMMFRIVVGDRGVVVDARAVADYVQNQLLLDCMRTLFMRIRFPQTQGGGLTQIELRIRFDHPESP